MKTTTATIILLCLSALIFVGCDGTSGTEKEPQIALKDHSESALSAWADETEPGSFTFTAASEWTAKITDATVSTFIAPLAGAERDGTGGLQWLKLMLDGTETYAGKAGTFVLAVELDTNYTGKTRSATVSIMCGIDRITVTIAQKGVKENGDQPADEDEKPVTAIELSPQALTLPIGETDRLKATVIPYDASDTKLTWNSSDEKVATVSSEGAVTALSGGQAVITVLSTAYPAVKATCTLTVSDAPPVSPNHVKKINGVVLNFDGEGRVIGRGSEMFGEYYKFEGSTLGGGGPLKSIYGQGYDFGVGFDHTYHYEEEWLSEINYRLYADEQTVSEGEITYERDEETGDIVTARDTKKGGIVINRTEIEYTDIPHQEGNMDLTLYLLYFTKGDTVLGPLYYSIFDNNLGRHSTRLPAKAVYSREGDPGYGWDHEVSFRYELYNGRVTSVYTTEKWAHETEARKESKLCDLYYN